MIGSRFKHNLLGCSSKVQILKFVMRIVTAGPFGGPSFLSYSPIVEGFGWVDECRHHGNGRGAIPDWLGWWLEW